MSRLIFIGLIVLFFLGVFYFSGQVSREEFKCDHPQNIGEYPPKIRQYRGNVGLVEPQPPQGDGWEPVFNSLTTKLPAKSRTQLWGMSIPPSFGGYPSTPYNQLCDAFSRRNCDNSWHPRDCYKTQYNKCITEGIF